MLTGSCLCGSIAYEVDADPGPIVHCHCATCRKTHGSAFSTVTNVPRDRFRWIRGEHLLKGFKSSPGKQRYFCTQCGSHIVAERPCDGHHPVADGMPGHRDRCAAEGTHLAVRGRALVRPQGSVAGMAGGQAPGGLIFVEHDLRANASRLSLGKPVPAFGIML